MGQGLSPFAPHAASRHRFPVHIAGVLIPQHTSCHHCMCFLMELIVRGHGQDLFRGLASLVDVGGGSGGAAKAIAAAFPHVKCSVLELPHVVASVPPGDGSVEFVAGDMFEHVPKADAVLLKV